MTDYYQTDSEPFSTSDLGCCAALVSLSFPLTRLDRSNPRRVLFVFAPAEGVAEAAERYFAGGLAVEARLYFDNLKMLKTRIYGG
jgi:hypothetical protein